VPRYRLRYFPESGNSYKLALMLALCGQPWEPVWTDFMGGQTRSPGWRATVNEMGEIPVLEDEGTRLTQTGAILLRLADRHSRFGGEGEAERFEVLRWLLWDNHKLTSYMATYRFMRAFTPDPNPEVLAFFRGRLDNILAIAERHFERIPFAASQRPTVADLSMSAYLSYPAEETGYDLPATHPAVAAWLGRIRRAAGLACALRPPAGTALQANRLRRRCRNVSREITPGLHPAATTSFRPPRDVRASSPS
jgi:glutathione S-transferase